jgi:hypothetical protein
VVVDEADVNKDARACAMLTSNWLLLPSVATMALVTATDIVSGHKRSVVRQNERNPLQATVVGTAESADPTCRSTLAADLDAAAEVAEQMPINS